MRNFSDFPIESKKCFVGPRISIEEILEKDIIVEFFQIGPSSKKPGTDCLTIQITLEENKHVIFSGSQFLMHDLKKVADDHFPFKAKIIRVNKHFEFR